MPQNSDFNTRISTANFFKAIVAINVALPILVSTILPIAVLGSISNYILFLLNVTVLLIRFNGALEQL